MISQFFNNVYSSLSSVPHDTLMWIIWGSFSAIFLMSVIANFVSGAVRSASKRPFLCFVNAYTAVTLAGFLTANELAPSILAASLFWCAGYLAYGLLCVITKPSKRKTVSQIAFSSIPPQQPSVPPVRTDTVPAKASVRLDHAMTVTDKLLAKSLGKSDRQELEKLKNTLVVLQMKGNLSTAETDILNDNFNALLKLMAKYNV